MGVRVVLVFVLNLLCARESEHRGAKSQSQTNKLRDADETGLDQIFGKYTFRVLRSIKKKHIVLPETSISKYNN